MLGALGSVEARKNAGGTYIDARLITATPKPKYKSAVELIAENVVTVSDESEESEVETQGDSTQYEKIVRKIRKKCNVKTKRNTTKFKIEACPHLASRPPTRFVNTPLKLAII